MSLQHDLLEQARQLAQKERKRPKQASLRRAISAAYYALFHLLVDESTRLLVSGSQREHLRLCVRRAFVHADMKAVAASFATGGVSPKMSPGLNGQAVQDELKRVGQVFHDLQQARHEADYDAVRRFTRSETLGLVEQAERAFEDWQAVKGSIQADTFLTALLVQRSLKG